MTRGKAIKHLEIMKGDYALIGDIEALDMAISALFVPEREKGEWIPNGSHTFAPVYRCSRCNESVAIIWGKEYKCCPNCGADMRGEV